MQVQHSQTSVARPTCEIRGGGSSWDGDDPAIKFTWFNTNGQAARGGEFPAEVLPEIVAFAISHGYVTPKDILAAVASVI